MGIAHLPGPPVEAVIALSIVFLAMEILKTRQGHSTLSSQKPWIVAFVFGLLHGFGFAGALQDIGLPQNEIPLALATFNIGVELGQILFVLVALVLISIIRSVLHKKLDRKTSSLRDWYIGCILVDRSDSRILE